MEKYAYITDLHLDESFTTENGVDARRNWLKILDDVKSRDISKIIFGGDIGEASSNSWFFKSLEEFDLNLTLGNHDSFENSIKYYNPGINEQQKGMYYSFNEGAYKFIFLDTSTGELSQTQLEWLTKELETSHELVVFLHHPVLDIGTTPQREFPWKSDRILQELLLKLNKKVFIFCGHLHLNDETTLGKVTQIVTPSASIQIKRDTEHTEIGSTAYFYRVITCEEEKLGHELVSFKD